MRRAISPSAWARHSTIAAAACRGPWPPIASCARSGARFRPRPFMWKRPQVIDSAGNTQDPQAAARRSQPLRGLRRMRVRLPAAGAPGRLRHQHRRKPLAQQPDSAQPESKERSLANVSIKALEVGDRSIGHRRGRCRHGMQESSARSVSAVGRGCRLGEDQRHARLCGQGSLAIHRWRRRSVYPGRRGFHLYLRLQVPGTSWKQWSTCYTMGDAAGAQQDSGDGQSNDAQERCAGRRRRLRTSKA